MSPKGAAGAVTLAVMLVGAIIGQVHPPYDPLVQDFAARLQPPTRAHPLGTDQFGRDVLSRLLAGAAPTLIVSCSATVLACGVGVSVGLICGSTRWAGVATSRLLDGVQAFPSLLLALVLAAVLGAGYVAVVLAIGASFFPVVARVTEAIVVTERPREYVLAARATGVSAPGVLLRHVLPNGVSALIVQVSSVFALATLTEAALSFLGLSDTGVQASWGRMLYDARSFMELAPHTVLGPLLAISGLVLAANLLGDELRDALDPRVSTRPWS